VFRKNRRKISGDGHFSGARAYERVRIGPLKPNDRPHRRLSTPFERSLPKSALSGTPQM
jgi:hypothetical protein